MIKGLLNRLFTKLAKATTTETIGFVANDTTTVEPVVIEKIVEVPVATNKVTYVPVPNVPVEQHYNVSQGLKDDTNKDIRALVNNTNGSVEADDYLENKTNREVVSAIDDRQILDWKELNRNHPEVVMSMKADLREAIYSTPIDFLKALLREQRVELLQDYYVSMLYNEGTYQPEHDNVDSLSKEQLVQAMFEISYTNFVKNMKAKGFEVRKPSEAQLKKLKDLGYVGEAPITSMGASKLIESVVGVQPNEPSAQQTKLIVDLIQRLNLQGEDYSYTTRNEASKVINDLQAIAKDIFGEEPASDKQKELYQRLIRDNHQKMTPKRKAFLETATKNSISEEINRLIKEIKENHPEVSKSQLDYLVSLHTRLFIPYNIDELKVMTKEAGTTLIAELNKKLLYVETRRYQASLTMKQIEAMPDKEVSDMLKQIQADKKDRNPR